jgi:hypothetical protein
MVLVLLMPPVILLRNQKINLSQSHFVGKFITFLTSTDIQLKSSTISCSYLNTFQICKCVQPFFCFNLPFPFFSSTYAPMDPRSRVCAFTYIVTHLMNTLPGNRSVNSPTHTHARCQQYGKRVFYVVRATQYYEDRTES